MCQASLAVIVKVTSKPTSGLNYVGTDAVNDVRFTLTGTTITVDDIVPIQAGEGCAPVAGDATKVTCVAFKAFGDFKPLFVDVLQGADTVRNQTSGTGAGETGAGGVGALGGDVLLPNGFSDQGDDSPDRVSCDTSAPGDPDDQAFRVLSEGDWADPEECERIFF